MASYTNNFDEQVAALQNKLGTFRDTMNSLPHTSRFVCEPGKERRDGYVSRSPKFYVFRFGQHWQEHLVPVKFGKAKLRCGHTRASEALETAKIDIINHGFNAFINIKFERLIDRKTDYVVGFPALLVSKNYRGDVNLLAERCNDDFTDAVYCTVCTPQLDEEFEAALEDQRTPMMRRNSYRRSFDSGYWLERQMLNWGAYHGLGIPYIPR